MLVVPALDPVQPLAIAPASARCTQPSTAGCLSRMTRAWEQERLGLLGILQGQTRAAHVELRQCPAYRLGARIRRPRCSRTSAARERAHDRTCAASCDGTAGRDPTRATARPRPWGSSGRSFLRTEVLGTLNRSMISRCWGDGLVELGEALVQEARADRLAARCAPATRQPESVSSNLGQVHWIVTD